MSDETQQQTGTDQITGAAIEPAPTVASIETEVKELEAQIAAKEDETPSEPTIAISQTAFGEAVRQIQAGVTTLARHSASNVAGSLFAESLIQLEAGLKGLKDLQP